MSVWRSRVFQAGSKAHAKYISKQEDGGEIQGACIAQLPQQRRHISYHWPEGKRERGMRCMFQGSSCCMDEEIGFKKMIVHSRIGRTSTSTVFAHTPKKLCEPMCVQKKQLLFLQKHNFLQYFRVRLQCGWCGCDIALVTRKKTPLFLKTPIAHLSHTIL